MNHVSSLWIVVFKKDGRERTEYLACEEHEIADLAKTTIPGRLKWPMIKLELLSQVHIAQSAEN